MKKHSLILFVSLIMCSALFAQTQPFKISVHPLTDNCYVFVSYGLSGGQPFPANGLYIVTKEGIVIVDTPWGEDETQQLIDSVEQRYHKKIVLSISTHFHADRTGGIDVLKKAGTKTYSSLQTLELCKARGEKQAQYYFTKDTTFTVGGVTVQTYYPGEGHTKDNIVVWLPKQKVLVGGCLVKSTETNNIGNVADANVKQWPATMQNVINKFPSAKYVIPGHQGGLDKNSLQHTIDVVKSAQDN